MLQLKEVEFINILSQVELSISNCSITRIREIANRHYCSSRYNYWEYEVDAVPEHS
eukprot:m.85375 g.85375  ORF g.85375 m.85375 type:complete len:56 (-) comp13006_c0_seq2:1142-1309(-)